MVWLMTLAALASEAELPSLDSPHTQRVQTRWGEVYEAHRLATHAPPLYALSAAVGAGAVVSLGILVTSGMEGGGRTSPADKALTAGFVGMTAVAGGLQLASLGIASAAADRARRLGHWTHPWLGPGLALGGVSVALLGRTLPRLVGLGLGAVAVSPLVQMVSNLVTLRQARGRDPRVDLALLPSAAGPALGLEARW